MNNSSGYATTETTHAKSEHVRSISKKNDQQQHTSRPSLQGNGARYDR